MSPQEKKRLRELEERVRELESRPLPPLPPVRVPGYQWRPNDGPPPGFIYVGNGYWSMPGGGHWQ